MKKRVFSIMDTDSKKAGAAIICAALAATMGTGFAFAADIVTNSPQTSGHTFDSAAVSPDDTDYADSLLLMTKPYEHLGVSVDKAAGLMMYEGKPVREIWDSVTGNIVTESLGEGFGGRDISGAVDLTVVYDNGKPIGFRVSTQEEYDRRTEERLNDINYELSE